MSRLWALPLALLVAAVVVLAPAAAPDRKPPRIVAVAMLDADRDSLADRVRLTYSERIRHPADSDGRYPFTVSGYRIRSVGKATGKSLPVLLVEQAQPDPAAAPAIRYRRTRAQPVLDRVGNQALPQLFARTRAHGHAPAAPPPPTAPPAPADADRDGTPDSADCAPRDAAIHPKAADTPDLGFVDSNCDGIDGNERDAVFVAPNGNDANPGTKARPKRELQAAIATVRAGNGRYVLVAFGTYGRVDLTSRIDIYGGYDPSSWQRRDRFPDGLPLISGSPEGVLAAGAKDVVLQHLRIRGVNGGGDRSAYGIRALGNASLTLQRVAVSAGDGAAGLAGSNGRTGEPGGAGQPGQGGACDGQGIPDGGAGGSSPAGRTGGYGGHGGLNSISSDGARGGEGKIGTPGGAGGKAGNTGKPGEKGAAGENGSPGSPGAGGISTLPSRETWVGESGGNGGVGEPGNGGGGGGGGGPQVGIGVKNADGNGAGGGGGGGAPGRPGGGGGFGGGSFGVYLFTAKVVVEDSSIAAGNGGAGGRGGSGGFGGAGGAGGKGGKVCTSEIGAGGDGGFGGAGGRGGGGGGGAGGPSIGIFKGGTSTATLKGSSKATGGTPGAGGAGGSSGPGGAGAAGAVGIGKPIHP